MTTAASKPPRWHFALVGNPNCGKTALFNALTGSRQKVANYPGVTVERKAGCCRPRGRRVDLVDLPGTYSLRARWPDEEITRDVVLGRLASEARARPARLRRRRHQLAAGAAPRARAEAGRPADAARAQHDGHRAQARRRDRSAKSCRRAWRAGGDLDRGAPRRHRRIAAPDRRDGGGAPQAKPAKHWQRRRTPASCARRSARPIASSRRGERAGAARHRDRRAVDAVLLHPVAAWSILLVPPVRHVPGGVRLGAAADGRDPAASTWLGVLVA